MPRTAKKPKREKKLIPEFRTPPQGGVLRSGGTNVGGWGAPRPEIRDRCARSFEARIHHAERILDRGGSTRREKLAALDLLGKYGGLQKVEHEHSGRVGLEDLIRELHDLDDETAATAPVSLPVGRFSKN